MLFVLVGMVWGLQMAITQDHAASPAHAHNNLIGFVSLFLFGIYYHLHPALEHSRLARIQVWVWIVATVIMVIGVVMVHTGQPQGDPFAAIGSIVVLLDTFLFGWLVFRTDN